MRIVFVGAGAMGSYIGGRITQAGGDVTLIDGWTEHVETIRRDGLRLAGTEGNSLVRVDAVHAREAHALSGRAVDVAFIAVKSYDTVWAARLARDLLSPTGFAVSLQNGINEPAIAAAVGAARTLGCVASTIGVALGGPGYVERTYRRGGAAYTVFRVGELDGRITERVRQVVAMLNCVDSAEATNDLSAERWAKLAANSMHNGLAAATGLGHTGVYGQAKPRWLAIRLGAEAVRVGRVLGFRVLPVRGIPADVLEAAGYGDSRARAHVEAAIQAWMPRLTESGRPSTAQDVLKGRRTEIEFINGAVCSHAAKVGIAVPCQQAISALVRRVERGEVVPAVANIDGI